MRTFTRSSTPRLVATALAATLALGACSNGDDTTPDLAFADSTTSTVFGTTTTLLIAEKPDVSLPEGEEAFVRFEAAWVCELQRRTFPTPEALQLALDQKLVDTGLTREDYDQFRSDVNNSQDLRDSILFEYQETCRP